MKGKIGMGLVVILLLWGSMAIAADVRFFIIKGKSGICRVIGAVEKTPKTIAGPYKTKEEAQKAKLELCGDTSGKDNKKKKAKKEEGFLTRTGKWAKKTLKSALNSALNTAIRRSVDDIFK